MMLCVDIQPEGQPEANISSHKLCVRIAEYSFVSHIQPHNHKLKFEWHQRIYSISYSGITHINARTGLQRYDDTDDQLITPIVNVQRYKTEGWL